MGIALRVLQEENPVRLWIEDPDGQEIGDDMVPKVGAIEDLFKGADKEEDIFIFDTSGNGVLADGISRDGFRVLGGSMLADRLEKDRRFARKVMEDSGIETPSSQTFHDFDAGIEFARRASERLVYKPSKRLGELSPSLVAYDQEDLIELLTNIKDRVKTSDVEFDLQVFIDGGLEISSEGWFNGYRWLGLFNHTFERKQFMDDNLGPSGGCTGNVVWACDGECPVCRSGIRRIEPFLRSKGYRGMIDLNAIVREDGLYGLEFTPRFGYDAAPTLLFELLQMEVGQFLADVAGGVVIDDPLRQDSYAGAVKISIPPWPTERYKAESDVPIRGIEDLDDFYWYNVKYSDGLASAGAWGMIALALGRSTSVRGAFAKPYRLAEGLRLQDKQYRTDLARQFSSNMEELEAYGLQQHVG